MVRILKQDCILRRLGMVILLEPSYPGGIGSCHRDTRNLPGISKILMPGSGYNH